MTTDNKEAIQKIKADFRNDSAVLISEMKEFIDTVAPYLTASDSVEELYQEKSTEYLNNTTFPFE